MFTIEGQHGTAACYATNIEDECVEQIRTMLDMPFAEGANTAIMRDGSIIAKGRGNEAWNNSAPHGAGRVMSRHDARESLSMDDYRAAMEGVYSTSVNERTIDEAPDAYKPIDDIIGPIADAVDIIDVMKPIYNFKAS